VIFFIKVVFDEVLCNVFIEGYVSQFQFDCLTMIGISTGSVSVGQRGRHTGGIKVFW
jgi:hypothetical protein